MSVRHQGSAELLNVYNNQNAGNPNSWNYDPDFSRPAYYDPVGELHAAHHVAGDPEEQVLVLVGRAAGMSQLQRYREFQRFAGCDTAPEATVMVSSARSASRRGGGPLPLTSRLLLEAGIGKTYYQWAGARARSEPGP